MTAHDPPRSRYVRPDEDEGERLDRHWNELLQELRLAQTGTQILFAFLLSIAFTNRFQDADQYTHVIFACTLVTSALAMGLFLAPVSFHRVVFQRHLRDRMIPIAGRMTRAGLILLLAAISGAVLLALDVVTPRPIALTIVGLVIVWFITFWYVLPTWIRRSG